LGMMRTSMSTNAGHSRARAAAIAVAALMLPFFGPNRGEFKPGP